MTGIADQIFLYEIKDINKEFKPMKFKKILTVLCCIVVFSLAGCARTSGNETSGDESADISESSFSEESGPVDESGTYSGSSSEPASPMQYRLHAVNVGDTTYCSKF